jgi:hypothetical protein
MIDGSLVIRNAGLMIDAVSTPVSRVSRTDGVLELSLLSGSVIRIPLDHVAASWYSGADKQGNPVECEIQTKLGFTSGEPFIVPRAPGDRRVPDWIKFTAPWHTGGYYYGITLYNDSFLPQKSDKDNPEAHRKLPHPRNRKADP